MSPTRLHQFDDHQYQQPKSFKSNKQQKYQINGARPTPLQLHKSSHVIHKSTSTTSSSTSSVSTASSPNNKYHRSNGPLIIHTYSPKVIHTKPRDFMALVQKLTGLSSVKHHEMAPPRKINEVVSEGSDQEGTGSGVDQDLNLDYRFSEKFDNIDRRFLSEIPLFTPNGRFDMFRSPHAHDQQQLLFFPATLKFYKPLPEC